MDKLLPFNTIYDPVDVVEKWNAIFTTSKGHFDAAGDRLLYTLSAIEVKDGLTISRIIEYPYIIKKRAGHVRMAICLGITFYAIDVKEDCLSPNATAFTNSKTFIPSINDYPRAEPTIAEADAVLNNTSTKYKNAFIYLRYGINYDAVMSVFADFEMFPSWMVIFDSDKLKKYTGPITDNIKFLGKKNYDLTFSGNLLQELDTWLDTFPDTTTYTNASEIQKLIMPSITKAVADDICVEGPLLFTEDSDYLSPIPVLGMRCAANVGTVVDCISAYPATVYSEETGNTVGDFPKPLYYGTIRVPSKYLASDMTCADFTGVARDKYFKFKDYEMRTHLFEFGDVPASSVPGISNQQIVIYNFISKKPVPNADQLYTNIMGKRSVVNGLVDDKPVTDIGKVNGKFYPPYFVHLNPNTPMRDMHNPLNDNAIYEATEAGQSIGGSFYWWVFNHSLVQDAQAPASAPSIDKQLWTFAIYDMKLNTTDKALFSGHSYYQILILIGQAIVEIVVPTEILANDYFKLETIDVMGKTCHVPVPSRPVPVLKRTEYNHKINKTNGYQTMFNMYTMAGEYVLGNGIPQWLTIFAKLNSVYFYIARVVRGEDPEALIRDYDFAKTDVANIVATDLDLQNQNSLLALPTNFIPPINKLCPATLISVTKTFTNKYFSIPINGTICNPANGAITEVSCDPTEVEYKISLDTKNSIYAEPKETLYDSNTTKRTSEAFIGNKCVELNDTLAKHFIIAPTIVDASYAKFLDSFPYDFANDTAVSTDLSDSYYNKQSIATLIQNGQSYDRSGSVQPGPPIKKRKL